MLKGYRLSRRNTTALGIGFSIALTFSTLAFAAPMKTTPAAKSQAGFHAKHVQLVKANWGRAVTVRFDANNANLTWEFEPNDHTITAHLGEVIHTHYIAKNNSDHMITVQAVPNIVPGMAAAHIKKIECFCFNQQTLAPGASMNMPLTFTIGRNLPKQIKNITLSYTLFRAKRPQVAKINGVTKIAYHQH